MRAPALVGARMSIICMCAWAAVYAQQVSALATEAGGGAREFSSGASPLVKAHRGGSRGFDLILGDAMHRSESGATEDKAFAEMKKDIQAQVQNATNQKEKEKAELIEENAKKAERAKLAMLNETSKLAAKKLSEGAKTSLSLLDRLAKAKLEQQSLYKTAVRALHSAAKEGEKDGLEQYEMYIASADAQALYVKKLEKKVDEVEEERRLWRAGKDAESQLVLTTSNQKADLLKTRTALQLTIKSGSDGDLNQYLGLRRSLESSQVALEEAQHAVDAAKLVQEKMADQRTAESLKDRHDQNPRVAMIVWESIEETAQEKYRIAKKEAREASKKALSGGNFAKAKEARDAARTLRLTLANATLAVAVNKVKAAEQFAQRILHDEQQTLRTVQKDQEKLKTLRDKMEAAQALQKHASETLATRIAEQQRSRNDMSTANNVLQGAKRREEELDEDRREAMDEHEQAFRELVQAKDAIRDTEDKLAEERNTRSAQHQKKIYALSTKIREAKADLEKLKEQQAKQEKQASAQASGQEQKTRPPSGADQVEAAAEQVVKKLTEEQAEELKALELKIETLGKASTGAVKEEKKVVKTASDQETEELESRRRDAEDKVAEAVSEVKHATLAKEKELRATTKREMDTKLEKIAAEANQELLKYEELLTSAKGDVRKRLLAKVADINERRDNEVSELRARMERTLKRRLKRVENKAQGEEKSAVKKQQQVVQQDEKNRIFKATLKKADEALKEVDAVSNGIIKQELSILEQKRDDIVEVTRNKVKTMQREMAKTTNEIDRNHIREGIEIVRKEADSKIANLTQTIKDQAQTKIAKDSIKILRAAKASAEKREERLRAFARSGKKRERKKEQREVERKFQHEEEVEAMEKKLTQRAMAKITAKTEEMQARVKLEAEKEIDDFEKVTTKSTEDQVDKLIREQSLVQKAMSEDLSDKPTEFNPDSNPYEGKPRLAKETAELMQESEKKITKFKEETMSKAEAHMQKLTLEIKAEHMEALSRRIANAKQRLFKQEDLKRAVDRNLRRSKRALDRSERKAAAGGKPVDELQVERARDADDHARKAAHAALEAAKRAKQTREREVKDKKVKAIWKKAKQETRQAAAELVKAGDSGSKAEMELAESRMRSAKALSEQATEARIDQAAQHGQIAYEKALAAGGIPSSVEPHTSEADDALDQLTHLVRRAMESKKRSDYDVAEKLLVKTERHLAHIHRMSQRETLRKSSLHEHILKQRMTEARKRFREAQQQSEKTRRHILDLKREARRRIIDVKNSRRALKIATCLSKIAVENYEIAQRTISRASTYELKMKTKVKQASNKINIAQKEERRAVQSYTELMKEKAVQGDQLEAKIEKATDKINSIKFNTEESIKEAEKFFSSQVGINTDEEKEALEKKINSHAEGEIRDTESEITLLKQEKAAKDSLAGENSTVATVIQSEKLKQIAEETTKKEGEIQKKKDEGIAKAKDEMNKVEANLLSQEKKIADDNLQAQKAADDQLNKLKLKKETAPTPEEKKQIEEQESKVREDMQNSKRDADSRIQSLKDDAREKKKGAEKAIRDAEEKANDKKKETEQDAAATMLKAKKDAQAEAQSLQKGSEEKQKEEKKAEKKLSAKEAEAVHQNRTDSLLKKLEDVRDEIIEALRPHLKNALHEQNKIAVEAQQKEAEQRVMLEQKQQAEKAEQKMVEADNAAIAKKVDDAEVKNSEAKAVAHKVEKMAQDETEYRKLAVGYALPIKVMPSQRLKHMLEDNSRSAL